MVAEIKVVEVDLEDGAEGIARLPQKPDPNRVELLVVAAEGRGAREARAEGRAGINRIEIGIESLPVVRDAHRHRVGQRHVEDASAFEALIVAGAEHQIAAEPSSSSGSRVRMNTAPAAALFPALTPCGPRRTSTLAKSK